MNRQRSFFLTLSLFLVLVPGALCAQADTAQTMQWPNLTVTTTDGQTYRDMTLAWVGMGQAILVTRSDGATRILAPDRISGIRDASGRDRMAEVVAGRYSPHQKPVPASRSYRSYDEIGGGPETLADELAWGEASSLKTPDPWLFGWAFGLGGGFAGTIGGGFPESKTEPAWGTSIRRRIYKTHYLSLSTNNLYLTSQTVPSNEPPLPGGEPGTFVMEWREEQVFLSFGHYYQPSAWYWEAGFGAVLRIHTDTERNVERTYIKSGLRLQAGLMKAGPDWLALNLAAYVTFKPGFEDADAGLALETGLRAELMVW